MKKIARRSYLASVLALVAAAAVVCGSPSAADPTADLSASKGAVTLASGANVSGMKTGDAPQSLKVGDVVSTTDEAGAKISLSKKDVLRLAANSSVTIKKWELSRNKKELAVTVSLDRGSLTVNVKKAKRKVVCDLEVAVGQAVLSGNDFAGKVVLLETGHYSVDVTRGTPLLQSGRSLVRLASGVTVSEGPPMTITASADNDGPVPAAYIGVVGLVLLPGQSVSLEVTDDGLIMTNTGDKPLYFCPWEKNAPQELQPGESVPLPIPDLGIGEDEVKDGDRTAKRFDLIIQWIRNAFPEVFPPAPKPWRRAADEPGDGGLPFPPPTRGPRGYHGSPSGQDVFGRPYLRCNGNEPNGNEP